MTTYHATVMTVGITKNDLWCYGSAVEACVDIDVAVDLALQRIYDQHGVPVELVSMTSVPVIQKNIVHHAITVIARPVSGD
jgi:hypothetical protein